MSSLLKAVVRWLELKFVENRAVWEIPDSKAQQAIANRNARRRAL